MFPYPESDTSEEEDRSSSSHTKFLSDIETIYVDTDMDLRYEFFNMCNSHGHWVILRKYDTTTKSVYWDENTQSAIGGPEWNYTDVFLKILSSREGLGIMPSSSTRTVRLGQQDSRDTVYYLPYYVQPTDKDLLITIVPDTGLYKPGYYKITQARKITRVDSMRDKYGRIEFHQVVVIDQTPTGDHTLR